VQQYRETLAPGSGYKTLIAAALPKSVQQGSSDGIYDKLVAQCAPGMSVTLQQSIVPDSRHSYALIPQNNIFYNDALTFGVDTNGFLTNGAPTSSSQVTAIASSIADTIGLGMAPGVGPAGGVKGLASLSRLLADGRTPDARDSLLHAH